mgnify:CR=1 FL=1
MTCLKIDLSRLGGLLGERLPGADRPKVEERIRAMKEQVDATIASVMPQAPRWKSSGTRLAKRNSSIVFSGGQLPP